MYSSVLAATTNNLIYFQFHHWTWVLTYFFLLLHSTRILWETPPKLIWFVSIIWFSALMLVIGFWEIMEQPNTARVIFWNMSHTHSSYFPQGAGFETKAGMIVLSSGHALLLYIFSLYAISLTLYTFLRVEPVNPIRKIILAKKLWISAMPIISIFYIVGLQSRRYYRSIRYWYCSCSFSISQKKEILIL